MPGLKLSTTWSHPSAAADAPNGAPCVTALRSDSLQLRALLELAIDRGAGVISARNRPPRVVGFFVICGGLGEPPRNSVSK
jgi:hypothetical protein